MGLYMKKNNQLVALAGIGDDVIPCATIIASKNSTAPDGFLRCDGTTFSLTDYPILATILGGTTLPDWSSQETADSCYYYIKATASAPTGIDVDAWKQYISSWVDVTSDWSVPYSSAGTPILEKVLWRPSTKELKVIVDASGISIAANSSFSIVAAYGGTNPDIVAMKDAPFEHGASIMPTNPRETYTLRFVPGSIQFGATLPEFYATVRNATSTAGALEHIVYHITL